MRYRIAINSMALAGKLPQGDRRWGIFNDSFDNLSLEPVEIADQIYKGYAIAAWHDGRRCLDNFVCAQHIGVDMDTEDERSRIDVLEQHEFVRMYAALAYTTPSHTDEAPRSRVLFLLDKAIESATAYGEAVQFVARQFADHDNAATDGSMNCQMALLGGVLPVAQLRRLYALDAKRNGKRQPTKDAAVISMDAIRQQRRADAVATNTPDELDKAADALRKIDPYSVDYNRWIGIISALKREFGDSALSLAESWAKGKPGEVRREWERIKTAGRGKEMHMGTIYRLASGVR
jgi:hypothetical protein